MKKENRKFKIGKVLKLLICFSCLLCIFGCSKNRKASTNNISANETQFVENVIEKNVLAEGEDRIKKTDIEANNLNLIQPFTLYRQYEIKTVDKSDVQLLSANLESNNTISIKYNNEEILKIDDLDFEITRFITFFQLYSSDRLYASSFIIDKDEKRYNGIVSLSKGFVKIYNWELDDQNHNTVFYSGLSDYFVFNSLKNVKLTYNESESDNGKNDENEGTVYLFDVNSDKVVYMINSKEIHKNLFLNIDKIKYINNNFDITIGNYMDSDEFGSFKLYTDNSDFRYELYDSYTYPNN